MIDNARVKSLLSLFEEIERLQKQVELSTSALYAPALNETRNATYHLLQAINLQEDEARTVNEITKAERHAKRAIYDCHEAKLLDEMNKFQTFIKEYRNVHKSPFIPNWSDMLKSATEAQNMIAVARTKYKNNRDDLYHEIASHVEVITSINNQLEFKRDELNLSLKKVRWGVWIAIITTSASIIAVAVSIF